MMRNPPPHLSRGHKAEDVACTHLQHQGLLLEARNYRSPYGEIDLIMRERDTLVFVEVRFRKSPDFGTPAETVDARKQAKLRATAEHYLQHTPRASKKACRFDIVAICGDGDDSLSWHRNAFE
jgi:putative endonuclease